MLNEITDKIIRTQADKLIDKNLTFDEKVVHAAYIDYIRSLDSEEFLKNACMLLDDCKSLQAYTEMDEISDMIDDFFDKKDGVSFDKIEEKIKNLLPNRLLHFNLDDRIKTYDRYKEKLYKFILYGSLIGRLDLLNEKEPSDIVTDKVKEDVGKLKGRIDIPPALWDHLNTIDLEFPYLYDFLDPALLQELCSYKAEISLGEFDKTVNENTNEIKRIKGEIVKNNKHIKKLRASNAITFSLVTVSLVVGLFGGIKFCKKWGWYKNRKEEENNAYIYTETQKGMVSYDGAPDYSYFWSKNTHLEQESMFGTSRRYVTVFGDTTESGKVNVKVYDYTDVDLTDEELKTIELDSNKIIYEEFVKIESLRRVNSVSLGHVYGVYTGSAHRDVTHVSYYKVFKTLPKSIVSKILASMIPVLIYMAFALHTLAIPFKFAGFNVLSYDEEDPDFDKEIEKTELSTKELIEQLDKLLAEAQRMQDQEIAKSTLDSIDERNKELADELEDYRVTRRM